MKTLAFFLLLYGITSTVFAQYTGNVKFEAILKTDTTNTGQVIVYPVGHPEVTVAKITIQVGKGTGWHAHVCPVFAYVQQGTLAVENRSGDTLYFQQGSAFAEMVGIPHQGWNNGDSDLVLIVFYAGARGQQLSTPFKQ